MTVIITSFTFENCIRQCHCVYGFSDISLLHLSHVSCILCMLDSLFTRCHHVKRSLTTTSQLSMSMAADIISFLQISLKHRQTVLCVHFSSLPQRRSFGILPFPILHMCPSHLRSLWLSRVCRLEHLAFTSTVVFGILSCQVIPRICLRQHRWNEFSFDSCLTQGVQVLLL